MSSEGFSLIELLVSMATIAILVAIAIFGLGIIQRNNRDTRRAEVVSELKILLEEYKTNNGVYPGDSEIIHSSPVGTIIVCKRPVSGSPTDCGTIGELGRVNTPEPYLAVIGPSEPNAETTTNGTVFCYSSIDPTGGRVGTSYILGVLTESGNWREEGISTETDCVSEFANDPSSIQL